jgi:uncharacterized coiled-coil DUF342 family protein
MQLSTVSEERNKIESNNQHLQKQVVDVQQANEELNLKIESLTTKISIEVAQRQNGEQEYHKQLITSVEFADELQTELDQNTNKVKNSQLPAQVAVLEGYEQELENVSNQTEGLEEQLEKIKNQMVSDFENSLLPISFYFYFLTLYSPELLL